MCHELFWTLGMQWSLATGFRSDRVYQIQKEMDDYADTCGNDGRVKPKLEAERSLP